MESSLSTSIGEQDSEESVVCLVFFFTGSCDGKEWDRERLEI